MWSRVSLSALCVCIAGLRRWFWSFSPVSVPKVSAATSVQGFCSTQYFYTLCCCCRTKALVLELIAAVSRVCISTQVQCVVFLHQSTAGNVITCCCCRTKALVLELLAAVCLVSGGHDIILVAFDNFKEVSQSVSLPPSNSTLQSTQRNRVCQSVHSSHAPLHKSTLLILVRIAAYTD